MNIGVDLDSTLIETHAAAAAAKDLGYQIHNKDVTKWNHLNFPEDLRKKIFEYFCDEDHMCNQAKPIERAQETISRWTSEGHNIILITARIEKIRESTTKMVNRLFPEIKDINFSDFNGNKKSLLLSKNINLWVDDAPHGVIDSLDMNIPTFLVSNSFTKYNFDVKNDPRLKGVVKIIADIVLE